MACAGERKGSPAPVPLPRAAVLPAASPCIPLATAALPKTQHSQGGMRSKSSRGSTGICRGGQAPLLPWWAAPCCPSFPLAAGAQTWGRIQHAQRHGDGISFPLLFFYSSSCLPKGAESMLLVCGCCLWAPGSSRAGMEAPQIRSDLRTVAHASCSQSVMRIGR